MRPLQIIILSQLIAVSAFAQIQPANVRLHPSKVFSPKVFTTANARSQQCATDTVYYGYAKATGLQGLNINTLSSADKAGQWYDAPQPMMLYGFTFFAWVASPTPDSLPLICRAILAGQDSLPTGPVIATTTVYVDTTFMGGTLSVIEKRAMFTNPVMVDYPFVLVVETASPLNVSVVASDWDSLDGGGEWLGMASILPNGWLHGYNINVGGSPFDADFVFSPIVSYSIDPSFTTDTKCIPNGGAVDFTNTTNSPVLESRFYNQYVFNHTEQLIYSWDYDDGSPLDLLTDTTHTFPAGSDYVVTLRSAIAGWSVSCQASYPLVINPVTTSDFTFTQSGFTVDFTNISTGADSSYIWDFQDSFTSTDINPSHTYAAAGDYEVSLITFGACGTDTVTKTVSLCGTLSSNFTYTASGGSVDFSVSSVTGSGSFQWNFGDGTSGSGITANHIYGASGTYNVCLIASNSCTADTTCQQLSVVSTGIAEHTGEIDWKLINNAATEELIIQLSDKNNDLKEVSLFNVMGKVIHTWSSSGFKGDRIVFDITGIPAATYYLVIKFAGNSKSGKAVSIY